VISRLLCLKIQSPLALRRSLSFGRRARIRSAAIRIGRMEESDEIDKAALFWRRFTPVSSWVLNYLLTAGELRSN
jgi:hypothetical protein